MKGYRPNHNAGFTLIEVLIALAILSIALTAVIYATAQSITQIAYLQNKTIANWVGINIMNQVRAGLLKLPEAPDHLTQETVVLGRNWSWRAEISTPANQKIQQIDVMVYQEPDETKLANLVGYLYAAQ